MLRIFCCFFLLLFCGKKSITVTILSKQLNVFYTCNTFFTCNMFSVRFVCLYGRYSIIIIDKS